MTRGEMFSSPFSLKKPQNITKNNERKRKGAIAPGGGGVDQLQDLLRGASSPCSPFSELHCWLEQDCRLFWLQCFWLWCPTSIVWCCVGQRSTHPVCAESFPAGHEVRRAAHVFLSLQMLHASFSQCVWLGLNCPFSVWPVTRSPQFYERQLWRREGVWWCPRKCLAHFWKLTGENLRRMLVGREQVCPPHTPCSPIPFKSLFSLPFAFQHNNNYYCVH